MSKSLYVSKLTIHKSTVISQISRQTGQAVRCKQKNRNPVFTCKNSRLHNQVLESLIQT